MKKMLCFGTCGRVEVPSDFPVGLLYNTCGHKAGEVVSQMEASDLPESRNISRLSFEYALHVLIKHCSMIEAVKLLRQYVGLDENGSLRMGLKEAKDMCDSLKAEMSRPVANEWRA